MLSYDEIISIEQNNNVKILLCSKEIDLGKYLWYENYIIEYYIISLNQDRKVSLISVNGKDIKSYSFEIWFSVSGWNHVPVITSWRALPFMSDMISYKDMSFYNTTKDMIQKHPNYRWSYGNHIHLGSSFNLDSTKYYLSLSLLSYWFSKGFLRLPIDIFEILNMRSVPRELLICTEMILSGTELDSQRSSYISELLTYHGESNSKLCSIGDIFVPEAEFQQLSVKLYSENQLKPNEL